MKFPYRFLNRMVCISFSSMALINSLKTYTHCRSHWRGEAILKFTKQRFWLVKHIVIISVRRIYIRLVVHQLNMLSHYQIIRLLLYSHPFFSPWCVCVLSTTKRYNEPKPFSSCFARDSCPVVIAVAMQRVKWNHRAYTLKKDNHYGFSCIFISKLMHIGSSRLFFLNRSKKKFPFFFLHV